MVCKTISELPVLRTWKRRNIAAANAHAWVEMAMWHAISGSFATQFVPCGVVVGQKSLSFAGLHEVDSLVVRNCSLRGKCGAPRTSYQRIGRCHATL